MSPIIDLTGSDCDSDFYEELYSEDVDETPEEVHHATLADNIQALGGESYPMYTC
jgi:hypothetical protein